MKMSKRNKKVTDSTSDQDRFLDKQRYDQASQFELNKLKLSQKGFDTETEIPQQFHDPFNKYYEAIYRLIPAGARTLELGCGSGRHTAPLFRNSGKVYACDISPASLDLLQINFGAKEPGKLNLIESSMDAIPVEDEFFDAVVSCGSWSYADQKRLILEINRVLRPGGVLIVLDTLNHNPLYRLKRYIRYKKGERTLSTIIRMPTLQTFQALSESFRIESVKYFGSFLWLYPILGRTIGSRYALRIESKLTNLAPKKLAFKFLLVAIKK